MLMRPFLRLEIFFILTHRLARRQPVFGPSGTHRLQYDSLDWIYQSVVSSILLSEALIVPDLVSIILIVTSCRFEDLCYSLLPHYHEQEAFLTSRDYPFITLIRDERSCFDAIYSIHMGFGFCIVFIAAFAGLILNPESV